MQPPAQNTSEDYRLKLRQAFGRFPTGVTVVTSRDVDGAPIGFTANSYTSVSLDPPLLLVCLAKTSSNLDNFRQASNFAVNILSAQQQDISNRFASRVVDRFLDTEWRAGTQNIPIIEDTSAWFECDTDNLVDAGDHIMLIGRITDFGTSNARPLGYLNGRYLELDLGEAAVDSVTHSGGLRVGCVLENTGHVVLQKDGDGWTIPMGNRTVGLREGRTSLAKYLAESGIAAELGMLYSVFDAPDGDSTWLVFLGSAETVPDSENFKMFPVEDLPIGQVKTKFVRSILDRFRSEVRRSRFGVYVDDANQSGSIQDLESGMTPWTKFIATQEKPL